MNQVGYWDDGTWDSLQYCISRTAVIDHLKSMNLNLHKKKVIDVGAGYGFFGDAIRKLYECEVTCVDFKQQNVNEIKWRFPLTPAFVANAEEDMAWLGEFDIVSCYNMLYHVENPILAMRNMGKICKEFMIISTCVCDSRFAISRLQIEDPFYVGNGPTPVVNYMSPLYLLTILNTIGFHVYRPVTVPDDREYKFEWKNDISRGDQMTRIITVASRRELNNPNLVLMTRDRMAGWE
jgi:SAM-dependent methyltransferase